MAILCWIGPQINALFKDPAVGVLVDPAVMVSCSRDGIKYEVKERIEVIAWLSEAPDVDVTSLARKFPILAVVADEQGSVIFNIPDPRVDPAWHEPEFWARRA
jgi:hypothetical protein